MPFAFVITVPLDGVPIAVGNPKVPAVYVSFAFTGIIVAVAFGVVQLSSKAIGKVLAGCGTSGFFQKAVSDNTLTKYKTINLKFTKQVVCIK